MSTVNVLLVALFSLITIINGQLNCSTYNPCGRYGYCRDNSDGEWTCKCKFWWNGTLCDEQTNSGKQVIALGCILGFLMAVFHGLQITLCIRNKRRKSKEDKKKEISQIPTLVDLALENAKKSTRLSSCLVACLTIIIAAVALVSKWSLIQPIHNEVATKYLTNQPIYYVPNSFCNTMSLQQFNIITFPVACFLILMLIITTKRTSLLPNLCYGYGGPPMPVDFLSHVDRTFAAFIFAVCADELLLIMLSVIDGTAKKGEGVIITYLLRVLEVFIMGVRYYALLAAVYLNTIFILACATIYAWLDYAITIINQGMCDSDFYPTYNDYLDNSTSIEEMFVYYGTGPNLIAIQLCIDIPRFLCLAYVNIKIPMLLIRKIYLQCKRNLPLEQKMLMKLTREQRIFFRISEPNSVEMLYVKNLFRSAKNRPKSQTLFARIIPTKIYEWRDDYRFSTRILCLYSSIFLLLYFVTIQACVQALPLLSALQQVLQDAVEKISTIFISESEDTDGENVSPNTSNFPLPSLIRPYLFAIFITLILIVIQLLVLLANIRRNSFQSFRGEDSEIPRRERSKYVSYAAGNFHFAGYFIGYLIWGYMIIAVFSLLFCISIDAFITYGSVRFLESILKFIIPSILFVLFKQYLNKILAQYIFLQHHGEVLSLNNRRFLMIFIYFNFFLDAFLGFISSILRLIKSVIGGIIYMCRLDYSPLGRKLETMDGGFSAYCGFIHTECAHRHPVMLAVVSHLYTQIKIKELKMNMMNSNDLSIDKTNEIKLKSQSRYVRKWKLAVFLTQNPTFVFFRKAFLNQLHIEDVRYLNDIDNNDKSNIQRRLSVYTRRMSAARLSIVSDNSLKYLEAYRF
ncbi:unnamed protein product [Rotaria sordida]|uniref:Receptor for retinol uptake STRA6 n=1 Tax=Rotaria sordida TaxID=392033 RepID=A0A815HJ33_9BILA|nr:unnamed protein product [Rotaria sordida]CAF3534585.1 unnamed protein product [Rotaria sordida]